MINVAVFDKFCKFVNRKATYRYNKFLHILETRN